VARWLERFGESAASAALRSDNEDSPADLLFDPGSSTREELLDALGKEGLAVAASPWAPLALTVTAGEVGRSALVASGTVAVVDAAAQALVELVEPAPVVVDLTAAPGGKTRTLLARGLASRVVALERNAGRVRRLARSLRAAGRRDQVLIVRGDAGRPPLPRASFRSVLLDAPCSGTGTLRKNPEIRWRLRPEDLGPLAGIQAGLLRAGLELVEPGGRLVYITCSLEREENEDVVALVLGEMPGYRVAALDPVALPVSLRGLPGGPSAIWVLPGSSNDGFTATVLERRLSS
jgi:16S rRNA (cytosine967-C5)-methyltransferase